MSAPALLARNFRVSLVSPLLSIAFCQSRVSPSMDKESGINNGDLHPSTQIGSLTAWALHHLPLELGAWNSVPFGSPVRQSCLIPVPPFSPVREIVAANFTVFQLAAREFVADKGYGPCRTVVCCLN